MANLFENPRALAALQLGAGLYAAGRELPYGVSRGQMIADTINSTIGGYRDYKRDAQLQELRDLQIGGLKSKAGRDKAQRDARARLFDMNPSYGTPAPAADQTGTFDDYSDFGETERNSPSGGGLFGNRPAGLFQNPQYMQAFARAYPDQYGAMMAKRFAATPKAPTVQSFYDDQGREYKAQWNPSSGQYERVGGFKSAQTPQQSADAREVMNARQWLLQQRRNLRPGENLRDLITRKSQEASATGRDNPAYDPQASNLFRKAMQSYVGESPDQYQQFVASLDQAMPTPTPQQPVAPPQREPSAFEGITNYFGFGDSPVGPTAPRPRPRPEGRQGANAALKAVPAPIRPDGTLNRSALRPNRVYEVKHPRTGEITPMKWTGQKFVRP